MIYFVALVAVPLNVAHAQSGSGITNITIGALNPRPPFAYGPNTVQATLSAAASAPNEECEITITNWAWTWSASLGSCYLSTDTNQITTNIWTWTQSPALPCGSNGISLTVSVVLQGTNYSGSNYTTNYSFTTNISVTVSSVSTTNWVSITCPALQNVPSLASNSFCQPLGSTPTVPSNTPPVYSTGLELEIVSNTCTGLTTNVTNTIINHVGPLRWQVGTNTNVTTLPPLTNAGGLSATAYVVVTNNDIGGCCPAPGRVDLGTATWCVSTNSTNFTDGTINLINTSTNTNCWMGSQVTLTVTTNITNAVLVLTTNCPCDTSLNGTWTTNFPPTILSNWWTVRGPGTYTNQGAGLSASFTPTNGGIGTVCFNLQYNNTPGDTNIQTATPCSVSFNVIQISNACEATYPTNLSRTNLGVGELVDLSLVGGPVGTFTWAVSGTPLSGSLNLNSGPAVTLTAPSNSSSIVVTVSYAGGSNTIPFSVFQPASVRGVKRANETFGAGTEGAGIEITVTVSPSVTNPVSFSRVYLMEVGENASSVTGYFADGNPNHAPFNHDTNHGANVWFLLDASNNWPHLGAGTHTNYDTADIYGYQAPWTNGSFEFDIPGQWKVDVGGFTNSNWLMWTQYMGIVNTNGSTTIGKFGISEKRDTNGNYTP